MQVIAKKNQGNVDLDSSMSTLFRIISILLILIAVGGIIKTLFNYNADKMQALIVFVILFSFGVFFWGIKLKVRLEGEIIKTVSLYNFNLLNKIISYSDFSFIKIYSRVADVPGKTDSRYFVCDFFSNKTDKLGILRQPILPTCIHFESLDDLAEKAGCVSFALNIGELSKLPVKIDKKSIVSYAGVEEYNKALKLMGVSNEK